MKFSKFSLRIAAVLTIWAAEFTSLHAQTTLLAWDFFGVATAGVATQSATTIDGHLDSSGTLTRGAGAAASSGANSFRTVGFQNNGISTANTDYFQFTVSAASGYTLSLSTIDYRTIGTASFTVSPGVSMQFAYSLDGTTFTLIGSAATTTASALTAQTQISLSGITALQTLADTATVTFRYYASGQTTTGGWGFGSSTTAAGTNGLAIGGTLTAPTVASLTWSGANNGTWDTSTANFASGATAWSNTTNATTRAIFATASQTINAATGITAGSVQFDATGITLTGGSLVNGNSSGNLTAIVTNSSDTATLSTSVTDGGFGFVKDGSGTLVLSGTQTNITGGITVASGTLQSDTGTIGSKNITDNTGTTLTFSQSSDGTYSGTLTNNGTFIKAGSGNVTMNNAVSGSGATSITGGSLIAGADTAIATGALTMASGTTLDLATHSATVSSLSLTGAAISNVGNLTVSGTGAVSANLDATTATIAGGTFALGSGAHTISTASGATLNISSSVTGTAATLTKSGTGTLILAGSNSGLTSAISLGAGTIAAGSSNALGTGQTKFNGGTLTGNGSALTLTSGTYQLQGGGGTLGGSSDLTLNGGWTDSGAATLNLNVTNTGATTLAGDFVITAAKTITTNVTTNLTMSGVLSGLGSSLTKTGTGTLALSGTNTFTGATTVNAGTLNLNGSLASGSAVAVNSGATLSGGGTVNGTLTLASGGSIAPGNSIGTLTANNGFTWNSGGVLNFELGSGNSSDLLAITSGAFAKGTGSTFQFNFLNTGTASNNYTLVSSTVTGTFVSSDFSYTNLGSGLSGVFAFNGNNLEFAVSAIPEPSTYAAIFGAAVLSCAVWRRRSQRKNFGPATPSA